MNEAYELLKWLGGIAVLTAMSIIGYFIREQLRENKVLLQRHGERLDGFDRCFVTREELEKTLTQMRADRLEHHHENRASLERIEHKIDENETRASRTRHDTKDEVHALAMQLAVISRQDRRTER
jgi:hypothetical protein